MYTIDIIDLDCSQFSWFCC